MNKSAFKTLRHIETVRNFINFIIKQLIERQEFHDQTKLESPEIEIFDDYTTKLRNIEYHSDEYYQIMKGMEVAIDHHYKHNRHHPEFFKNGIKDMNLIDLIEMVCDWKAASLRHSNGDIYKSIEINQKRFGYSDELKQIFNNTIDLLISYNIYNKADES